jgi:RNA polymerase sigma factor (sigma-70 family)
METFHEVYGRVTVDPEELATDSKFIKVTLMNERPNLPKEITVGKAALKDKGGYVGKRRPTTLVEDYLPIAYGVASSVYSKGLDWDELLSVATLGLVEAAGKFDPEKGNSFASIAKPYAIGYLKNYLNPERNGMMNISVQAMWEVDNASVNSGVSESDKRLILSGAVEQLTKRQKFVIDQIYRVGHTQQTLAKRLGVSQQAVSRTHDRAIVSLRQHIENITPKT